MNIELHSSNISSVYLMACIQYMRTQKSVFSHDEFGDFLNMYDGCAFE